MAWMRPWYKALLQEIGYLLPQALFVPPMQQAINRRAADRIKTLRRVSGDIVESGTPDDERVERVFELNMGIYKLKYGMNLGMNLMYAFAVAAPWRRRLVRRYGPDRCRHRGGRGLWPGQAQGSVERPGELGRELSVDSVKYRLFVDAVGRRGLATA